MRVVPRPPVRRAPSTRRRRAATEIARARRAFGRLVSVMRTLRSPDGCPWDRRQTHQSLRPYLLEETYEALDALDRQDHAALPGELGDVLFQCVFHAEIAAAAGRFDIADAIDAVVAKLIRRHPHVFTPAGRRHGRPRLAGAGAVVEQWERLKAREQVEAGSRPRILAGIPRSMPALLRAHEIGSRVAAVGFDWPAAHDVMDKLREEVAELGEALHEGRARAVEEFGDVLFTLANLARKLGLEPESALRSANDKFSGRFEAMEDRLTASGRSVHETAPAELERLWTAVKKAPRRRKAPGATAGRTRPARRPTGRRSRS